MIRPSIFPVCSARAALAFSVCAAAATAQCGLLPLPSGGPPGFAIDLGEQPLAVTEWDPDGSGPASPLLVFGGAFTVAGDVLADNLVAFDPVTGTWSLLGAANGPVYALAVLPNGDLAVGGGFTQVGGVAAANVAIFANGTWSPLGTGIQGPVYALTALANGDVVAGGRFVTAGLGPANSIARWDGAAWNALAAGIQGEVRALVTMPNGDLFAGGAIFSAGGGFADSIARWDGSNWTSPGLGLDGAVWSLAALPNGDLVAGGEFRFADLILAPHVARWNGTSWSSIGGGVDDWVFALAVRRNGDLVAAGMFENAAGQPRSRIAAFDGSSWNDLNGGVDGTVRGATVTVGGALVAVGTFRTVGTALGVGGVGVHDGTAWSRLPGATNGPVRAITALADGGLVVGGDFRVIGGVDASRVAIRRAGVFQPLGSGVDGPVNAVCELPDGDVVVGGTFTRAGAVTARGLARWDGVSWQELGGGVTGAVSALALAPDGALLVAGTFAVLGGGPAGGVVRWDGSSWTAMGTLGQPPLRFLRCLAVDAAGDVLAGGIEEPFSGAGPVHRFDGAQWVPLASGLVGAVNALVALPSGAIVAGGLFLGGSGVATYDGVSFSVSASSPLSEVTGLVRLPDGDVIAAAMVAQSGTVRPALSRFDGVIWSPLSPSVEGLSPQYSGARLALAWSREGTLAVAGHTASIAGRASSYFVEIATSCPAASDAYGSGCSGGAGLVELRLDERAFVGGTFSVSARGVAPGAFALAVFGSLPISVPLSAAHPAALPGCSLLVVPDLGVELLAPSFGALRYQVPVPDAVALIGAVGHLQLVQVESGPSGAIAGVSSSAGLRFAVGAF